MKTNIKKIEKIILQLKLLHKLGIGLILLVGLAFSLSNFWLEPKLLKLANLNIKIENDRRILAAKEASLNKGADFIKYGKIDLTPLLTELEVQGNKVIIKDELPLFLEILQEVCDKSGNTHVSITESLSEKIIVSLTSDISANNRNNHIILEKLPLNISLNGKYNSFIAFLTELENIKNFIAIDNFKISTPNYTSSLRASINMFVYMVDG